ncbi:MAG: hypothetical protein GX967_00310 [Clostridiales bacterium]|nr:hypothetical protein [Clostridiales bacterium]
MNVRLIRLETRRVNKNRIVFEISEQTNKGTSTSFLLYEYLAGDDSVVFLVNMDSKFASEVIFLT